MSRSCKRYFNEWVSVAIGFTLWGFAEPSE
jgi:hypothetical protein